jgi:hypothetical protein
MTGQAIRGVGLLCLPFALLTLVSALSAPAHAVGLLRPVLVYQNPREAEVIQQPAFGIQLCFASPVCKSSSGTAAASQTPEPGARTPAAVSASPLPTSGRPSASATPSASPIAPGSSSNGPDILKYSLLTIGAAGAAGVILLIGYLIRRRVGYDPHREKPGGDDGHH